MLVMILKMLHISLLASVKYLLTIPYARIIGLNFEQSLIAVLIGGIGGFLFFYYLSGYAIKGYRMLKPYLCVLVPPFVRVKYDLYCEKREKKKSKTKIFSRKNRTIAKIKKTYGLWGIIVTTPILLTIPVGAFLANKYYSGRRYIVGYMLASIIIWALILTSFFQLFPGIVN